MRTKEIIHEFSNLKYNLCELLSLEWEKTFAPHLLAKWILLLKSFKMVCPCKFFNYQISTLEFKCPIYSKSYFCSSCSQLCQDCDLSCDWCERNDYWFNIKNCIKNLESFRKSNLWKFYTCLFLANELKILLHDQSRKLKKHYPEEFSFPEVIEVLNKK